MYKDKEKQREANRLAKQRGRKGMTSSTVGNKGMTQTSEYALCEEKVKIAGYDTAKIPSIIYRLVDPVQRANLEKVSNALRGKKLGHHVWLGSVNMETVDKLLACTRI